MDSHLSRRHAGNGANSLIVRRPPISARKSDRDSSGPGGFPREIRQHHRISLSTSEESFGRSAPIVVKVGRIDQADQEVRSLRIHVLD